MTRDTYMPVCVVAGSVVLRADPDGKEHPFAVLPLSVGVELNSYRQADTFDVEFDAARFPFHTDDIRSMSMEVRIFERRGMTDDVASMSDAVTPLVLGRCDELGIRLSDDGRTFTARGKDYTEVLSVRKWDASDVVAPGRSLRATVQDLVDKAASASTKGRVLTVVYIAPTGESPAFRGTSSSDRSPRVEGRGTKAKGLTWPSDVTYFDVITDLCAMYGKRVFVRGLEVVISTPADLVDDGTVFDDNGKAGQHQPREFTMAWGRNISALELTRKAGGERTPQQVVKAYDPKGRKTLTGRYPKVRSDSDPEAQVRLVHAVADQAQVDEMARTAWHEISRGESEIEIETSDLTDLRGKSLLDARAGDSIRISFEPFQADELSKMGKPQRLKFLIAAGFGPGVAAAIAENLNSLERWNRVHYIRRVMLDWSSDDGLEIKIGAVNYLGQRATQQLQEPSQSIADATFAQNLSETARAIAIAAGDPRQRLRGTR